MKTKTVQGFMSVWNFIQETVDYTSHKNGWLDLLTQSEKLFPKYLRLTSRFRDGYIIKTV